MNVFLMRHGDAEPASDGKNDKDRHLTPEGEKSIVETLPGIRKLCGRLDYILTSPAMRALQTAAILAEDFKCLEFIEAAEALAVSGGEDKVAGALNKLIGKDNILVVGHMPHLSDLARYLTAEGSDAEIDIKKGGMVKIYIAGFPGRGEGAIRWIMSPEELKKV